MGTANVRQIAAGEGPGRRVSGNDEESKAGPKSKARKQLRGNSQDLLKSFENSFVVLGELSDERIAIWSIDRKLYFVRIQDLNYDKMLQIGGSAISARVARRGTDEDERVDFRTLKAAIIIAARKNQLGQPSFYGQGIHWLDESKCLLLVNGAHAWIWNGKSFVHQKTPIIGRAFIGLEPGAEWIDWEEFRKYCLAMDRASAGKSIDELLALIRQWGFSGPMDHLVVTGWMIAQLLQKIFPWRPHLWITGATASGKTLLVLLWEKIGGRLSRRYEGSGTSEAGIRQDLQNDSFLPCLDEAENTEHRQRLLETLRSSNRGGFIVKGTTGHQNVKFEIRHMFMLASIEVGLTRAAENTRYLIVRTDKDPRRRPIIPNNSAIAPLRIRLFAAAVWMAFQARELISRARPIPGVDSRFVDSLAVVFAPMAIVNANPEETLNRLIADYLEDWAKTQHMEEDESKLLEDILTANIRLPLTQLDRDSGEERIVYDNRTVAQLMDSAASEFDHQIALETHGVRVRSDGIFIHPKKARRELLKNSDWQELNLREILLRVPGAVAIRDKLAGTLCRGVLIPNSALADIL
jgi:hypothetical protein